MSIVDDFFGKLGIPSANDLPQDDNPDAPSVSLPSAGSGGGFADTASKFLGQILNYQLQRDAAKNASALNAHAQTVATPLSSSLLRSPSGGVNVLGVLLVAGAAAGLVWLGKKALA